MNPENLGPQGQRAPAVLNPGRQSASRRLVSQVRQPRGDKRGALPWFNKKLEAFFEFVIGGGCAGRRIQTSGAM